MQKIYNVILLLVTIGVLAGIQYMIDVPLFHISLAGLSLAAMATLTVRIAEQFKKHLNKHYSGVTVLMEVSLAGIVMLFPQTFIAFLYLHLVPEWLTAAYVGSFLAVLAGLALYAYMNLTLGVSEAEEELVDLF